ncbi:hypothetical protein QBC38DRAFT_158099 [Podospora fimiseda]|uniref:Uncharacterized protein n=1 Tax=Podospora fimiseda TaxID=252190 RepID=A0AAN7BRL4_9PEZI|nr:hypothetical protein QBC38DRAFT_158099 [Podospora fimiseda]
MIQPMQPRHGGNVWSYGSEENEARLSSKESVLVRKRKVCSSESRHMVYAGSSTLRGPVARRQDLFYQQARSGREARPARSSLRRHKITGDRGKKNPCIIPILWGWGTVMRLPRKTVKDASESGRGVDLSLERDGHRCGSTGRSLLAGAHWVGVGAGRPLHPLGRHRRGVRLPPQKERKNNRCRRFVDEIQIRQEDFEKREKRVADISDSLVSDICHFLFHMDSNFSFDVADCSVGGGLGSLKSPHLLGVGKNSFPVMPRQKKRGNDDVLDGGDEKEVDGIGIH